MLSREHGVTVDNDGTLDPQAGHAVARLLQPPLVLLIEDDPGDALLVEELAADTDIELRLVWVRTMAHAQRELATGSPDCVLLDLNLPDAHGLGALGQIREHADHVAVVVLTGLADERAGLAAVAAGAQDYLVKGRVDAELLARAVRYAIQRKQAEKTAAALRVNQIQARENARLERGLLPTPLLRDDHGLEVVARYRSGRAHALLGGDFYDVVQTDDGSVHALIGDVCGHGPDEAALGVALRIAWRTSVLGGIGGLEQLRLLEKVLVAERSAREIFATLTTVVLSPCRTTARVMRIGHPGMLMRHGGAVEWVEVPGGAALGLIPGRVDWPLHELRLPPGAGLMLFTDGLFEGHTGTGNDRLGEAGLLELAKSLASLDSDMFVDRLISEAEARAESRGGLVDDVAALHLRWVDPVPAGTQ